jgi:hypothetical protein
MNTNRHEENQEPRITRMARDSVIRNSLHFYIVTPVRIDALLTLSTIQPFNDVTRRSRRGEAISWLGAKSQHFDRGRNFNVLVPDYEI